jgi:hypothetical protein
MPNPGTKGVTIRIAHEILGRIDALQPSHLTRKAFVNEILDQGVKRLEKEARQTK